MRSELQNNPRLNWLSQDGIRPYVFVRPENRIKNPGNRFSLDWFSMEPLYKNPLQMEEVDFADQILRLETAAFSASGMPMPRWVFYDCAIVPGFVAGFAIHKSKASPEILKILQPSEKSEWIPISLFIIIPTMAPEEWVAHNLCSINSMVSEEKRFYGLGFLTKAFGLWYANIRIFSGITQWRSPAVRLHTHYGDFEVLTAYTPVHSYAQTLTYRVTVDTKEWKRFFTQEQAYGFHDRYQDAGFLVDPKSEASIKAFQSRLEGGEDKYFLDSNQIRTQQLDAPLKVYRRKKCKRWLWQRI
jgi:hypothetical protein